MPCHGPRVAWHFPFSYAYQAACTCTVIHCVLNRNCPTAGFTYFHGPVGACTCVHTTCISMPSIQFVLARMVRAYMQPVANNARWEGGENLLVKLGSGSLRRPGSMASKNTHGIDCLLPCVLAGSRTCVCTIHCVGEVSTSNASACAPALLSAEFRACLRKISSDSSVCSSGQVCHSLVFLALICTTERDVCLDTEVIDRVRESTLFIHYRNSCRGPAHGEVGRGSLTAASCDGEAPLHTANKVPLTAGDGRG